MNTNPYKVSTKHFALCTDSYKLNHPNQKPDGLIYEEAYGAPRAGLEDTRGEDNRIVFFGMRFVAEVFQDILNEGSLENAKVYNFLKQHLAGYDPEELKGFLSTFEGLEIYCLREGSVVMPNTPVFKIGVRGKYAKFSTFLEPLLTHVCHSMKVATRSRQAKEILKKFYDITVEKENYPSLDWKLHDFGYRGVSGNEQAVRGGVAHLLSFNGTDNILAGYVAYNSGLKEPVPSSVEATEHAVVLAHKTELDAVLKALESGAPVSSLVADTYDYNNFLKTIVPKIAEQAQKQGTHIVVRPDSGDPVVCVIDALVELEKHFPTTVNKKGYRVIEGASVIQGDGIDIKTMERILYMVMLRGFSVENVTFGMGNGLLYKGGRDSISFATKACYQEFEDGRTQESMKIPKTDMSKSSIPGQTTVKGDTNKVHLNCGTINNFVPFFKNGKVVFKMESLDKVKKRMEKQWELQESNKTKAQHWSTNLEKKINRKIKENKC